VWMIVGLGNPGDQYQNTRHNFGFLVLDLIAARQKVSLKEYARFAVTGTFELDRTEVLLVKPQTYMNRSGEVVGYFSRRLDLPPESIIIIHDDLDLPFEMLRIKKRGGAGGHRGIESILNELGTDRFLRIKLGISRPDIQEAPQEYVLSCFSPEQEEKIPGLLLQTAQAAECMVLEGVDRAMNLFNVRT